MRESGAASAGGLAADPDARAQQEIKALEFHLADLLMRREFDAYGAFLAEDYTRITDRGEVQSREEVLRQFAAGTGRGGLMEPSDLKVTGLLEVTPAERPPRRRG